MNPTTSTGPGTGAGSAGVDLAAAPAVPGLVAPIVGPPEAVLGRVDLRAWARGLGARYGVEVDHEVSRLRTRLLDVLQDLVDITDALADVPEADLRRDLGRVFDLITVPAARLDVVRRTAAEHPEAILTPDH